MSLTYLAPPIFLVIAFVFSMLGMGGSQLYVPILYWLGMDFKTEAIPLGMLLNVVNSVSAVVTYAGKRLINWRVALPFTVTMVAFAPLGAWANVALPTKSVIVAFALFTAAAGGLMLSGWRPRSGGLSRRGHLILGLSGGTALGFIAGLIGRGGGSFVVPMLYIAGLDPKMAAATSALAVSGSGISSFIAHLATAARPQWVIWGLCVLFVLIGSQLGSRFMVARLKGRGIKLVFGGVLLGVAALLLIKDVVLA